MATTLAQIEEMVRDKLNEPTPKFWTSAELRRDMKACQKDLWRAIVDLKGEHYLTINTSDVSTVANSDTLTGVPSNVHKVYNIEVADPTSDGVASKLYFTPLDYNHKLFASARSNSSVDASGGGEIYYAIIGQGAPVSAPVIRIAPTISSAVALNFAYVPTIDTIEDDGYVHIPGEADNAIVAWTIAYARSKEREDRAPDPGWLSIYASEKRQLLQSLGLRQLQEPTFVDGLHAELW